MNEPGSIYQSTALNAVLICVEGGVIQDVQVSGMAADCRIIVRDEDGDTEEADEGIWTPNIMEPETKRRIADVIKADTEYTGEDSDEGEKDENEENETTD